MPGGYLIGHNTLIGDYSAAISTTSTGLSNNIDIPSSDFRRFSPQPDALYLVTAQMNPSTNTVTTVIVKNTHTAFGAYSTSLNTYSELTRWTLSTQSASTNNDAKDVLVQGWMLGSGARITFSNVSTSPSTALTCYFRVTKV